jgi:hypothetical protein
MSNTNKRLIYTFQSTEDSDMFYVIGTIFVGESLQVIDSISFSDKWKSYDTVGLTEKQLLSKFDKIGASVLGMSQTDFDTQYAANRKQFLNDNMDNFIDTLLDFNNSNGVTNFPFQVGHQFANIQKNIDDYLETVTIIYEMKKNFENKPYIIEE